MAQIKLLSLPSLDATYQNVIDFASLAEQSTWFDNKSGRVVEGNIKTDTEQEQLVLNLPYHLVKPYDYLYFKDTNGKRVYYFIASRSIKTSDTTVVSIVCDVWNTYMFDYSLMDSFVERCHVPRWQTDTDEDWPAYETIDEGFVLGDYSVHSVQNGYKSNETYVIASSVPLGYLKDGGYVPPSGGDGTGGCGDISKGEISPDGFRFIKGYEAFGPYAYDDGFGFMTIAYGVTAHGEPEIYNKLLAKQPVAEEEGAKISYQLKIDNYGMKIKDNFLKIYSFDDVNKFDAVLSFAYNLGIGVMNESHSFYKALATKDEETIRTEWMKYINAGGVPVEGLRLRRKAELDIFFDKKYEMRAIPVLNANGTIAGTVEENNGNGWLPTCSGDGATSNPTGLWINNELGKFACPTTGTVSALYPAYPSGGAHNGNDIANVVGTSIYAVADGTVTVSGPVSGFGHAIYIDHGNGIEVRYGHMFSYGLLVKVGDKVKQGQKIALMGNDGQSTGSHLHFDFKKDGKFINPSDLTLYQKI